MGGRESKLIEGEEEGLILTEIKEKKETITVISIYNVGIIDGKKGIELIK